MPHAHVLERVRETVKSAFAAQGLTSLAEFSEAILIRDGCYCGRLFTCAGLRAVWFVEENRLKLFGPDNELLYSQPAEERNSGGKSARDTIPLDKVAGDMDSGSDAFAA